MNFWKKHTAAWIVTVVVVGITLFFAVRLTSQTVQSDYYARWIMDDAGLLDQKTCSELVEIDRRLDGTYDSLVALVTADSLSGQDAGTYAYGLYESCGVGQNDMILLLTADGEWYLAYGDGVAPYADNRLRLLAAEQMDGAGTAADRVPGLYRALEEWYRQSVPAGLGRSAGRSRSVSGRGGLTLLLILLAFVAGILLLTQYLLYPLFRYRELGKWRPLWGGRPLGFLYRRKTTAAEI